MSSGRHSFTSIVTLLSTAQSPSSSRPRNVSVCVPTPRSSALTDHTWPEVRKLPFRVQYTRRSEASRASCSRPSSFRRRSIVSPLQPPCRSVRGRCRRRCRSCGPPIPTAGAVLTRLIEMPPSASADARSPESVATALIVYRPKGKVVGRERDVRSLAEEVARSGRRFREPPARVAPRPRGRWRLRNELHVAAGHLRPLRGLDDAHVGRQVRQERRGDRGLRVDRQPGAADSRLRRREQRALDLRDREAGLAARTSAATPETTGAEALVPVKLFTASGLDAKTASDRSTLDTREPRRPDVDGSAARVVPSALEVASRRATGAFELHAEAADAEHARGLARPVVRRFRAGDEAAELVDVDAGVARRRDEQRASRPDRVGGHIEEGGVEPAERGRNGAAEAHVDDAGASRLHG